MEVQIGCMNSKGKDKMFCDQCMYEKALINCRCYMVYRNREYLTV